MSVILVTGGSGLVGQGIKHIIETEPVGSRFGKREGETWVFVKSREGDLRWVEWGWCFFFFLTGYVGMQRRQNGCLKSISLRM